MADPSPSEELEGLLEFLYLCPVGLIRTRLDGAVEMMNAKAAQLLLPIARTTANLDNVFDILQDHAPEVRNLVSAYPASHGVICEYHRIDTRHGSKVKAPLLAITVIRLRAESGQLMIVLEDITTLVEQEQALRNRELRLRAIFDGVRDYAIYSLDETGKIETWNRSAERVEGFRSEEAIGQGFGLDYPPESRDPARIQEVLGGAAQVGWHEEEGWRVRRDGARFWANTMVSVFRESDDPASRVQGFSVVTRDITDRKQAEDTLRKMAATDYLTGVFNRRYFFENAPAAALACAALGKPVSVLMLDADKFKLLNDTLGHDAGDHALRIIADTCRRLVGPADIVARFGGEEFAILLLNRDANAGAAAAERIRVAVEASEARVTVSAGVSLVEGDPEDALRAADAALYEAKEQGRNRVVVAKTGSTRTE